MSSTKRPSCQSIPPKPHPAPQEELEAYDKHQRLLEDQLDGKTAELIGLRRQALEAEAARARSGQLQEGVAQVRLWGLFFLLKFDGWP